MLQTVIVLFAQSRTISYSTSFQPATVEQDGSGVQELYGTLFDQDQEVVVLVPSVQDETVSGEVSVAVAGLPETNSQKNRKRNRSRFEASKKSKKARKPYYRRKVRIHFKDFTS